MTDFMDTVFGPDGLLAGHLDNYEPRQGQLDMAAAVVRAIADQEHLQVEAPTGTGKSLAYLVPAIQRIAEDRVRVVVATANIALQEQLVSRDLPFLKRVLPLEFSYCLLKGRNNYLCLDRFYQLEGEGGLLPEIVDEDDRIQAQLVAWARRTEFGDVSELPFQPQDHIWRRYSTGSEDCKGSDCPQRALCFANQARERALRADLVVTNYHLLFAHLAVRAETGRDLVLPPFHIVVCDEGHRMADIARDFFGLRITQGAIRWAGRHLASLGLKRQQQGLFRQAELFFTQLAAYRQSERYRVRLKEPGAVPWEGVVQMLAEAGKAYQVALDEGGLDDQKRPEISNAVRRCNALRAGIQDSLSLADPDFVVWIDRDHLGRVSLCSKPISVAATLADSLFASADTVVVTSATLTSAGSFEYLQQECGSNGARQLVVDSPFDVANSALLVVPAELPEPNSPDFGHQVASALEQVIEQAAGRTLALFTSYRNLDIAWEHLQGSSYTVLRQGDLPRTQLVEEFRRDVHSVLLGTESFRTGVDVPGEALSCVVLDRLPFTSPEDPLLDALQERDPRSFRNFSLPRAVIAFKQGVGRLLRRTTDRGVVVVLDRRLVTRGYGRVFLGSLPLLPRADDYSAISAFFSEGR